MKFAKVFPMLIAKAERKGRTREEVYELTEWLTGYSSDELDHQLTSDTTYGEFFDRAPRMHPTIKGSSFSISKPLSSNASLAATTAYWAKSSIRRADFLSMATVGSKSFTSAPK